METCQLLLLDVVGEVTLERLRGCQVFIGACRGSVFLRECHDCVVTAAWCVSGTMSFSCNHDTVTSYKSVRLPHPCSGQLRLNECSDCIILAHTPHSPALDRCRGIVVGPHNGAYRGLEEDLRQAGLSNKANRVHEVIDFSADSYARGEPSSPGCSASSYRLLGASAIDGFFLRGF